MQGPVATCQKPHPALPAMPDINTQKRPPHLQLTDGSGTSVPTPSGNMLVSWGNMLAEVDSPGASQPMWFRTMFCQQVFVWKFFKIFKQEGTMHARAPFTAQKTKLKSSFAASDPSSRTVFPKERSPGGALGRQRFRTPPQIQVAIGVAVAAKHLEALKSACRGCFW